MAKALVSVIIPAFNSGEYIVEAIESTLRQTYPSVEIIVVDDGSTDDTRERLSDLIANQQIRYVRQDNKGLSAARNTGIRLAGGKYLQFLDADDLIEPTKLEKQVALLERATDPSICGCDFRHFNGSDLSTLFGGDHFRGKIPFDRAWELFAFHTVIHRWLFPAYVVKQVGGFDESRPDVWLMEDWLMLWKLAAQRVSVLYVDEPLALYRRHGDNMTADVEKAAAGHFIALDYVEEYQRKHQLDFYSPRELQDLRESYHYELGLHYLRSNQTYRAVRELTKALLMSPNRRQAKLLLVGCAPFFRGRTIEWSRTADERLWRWRSRLRRLAFGKPIARSRRALYEWRQRRAVKRFGAFVLLLLALPVCWTIRGVLNLFSARREPRRILVIQFAGLGDTLMLTPSLAALNDRYPNAHIELLTLHEYVKEAFAHHPRFSAITVVPVFPGHWIISRLAGRSGPRLILATLRYYPDLLLKFAFARYDSAVNFGLSDFDRSLGNALLYCLGIPTRVGARGANGELLTHRAEIDCTGTHRVEAYLEFLKPLNISAVNHTYEFPVSPADS
ncbi:MAG TPA: glycosyltransferase, partial [Pyrinomonadaceae bacterium]